MSRPSCAPSRGVQAPAASTTWPAAMGPRSVSIRVMRRPVAVERPDRCTLHDRGTRPLRRVRERPDVAARIHLGVERAVRRGHDSLGQDRGKIACLVAGQVLHRHAVRHPAGHEIAHDDGLGLGHRVDEPAATAQAEVLAELVGQRLQAGPCGHHEVELWALPARVDPDEPEVPPGRAGGEAVRLEQGHGHAPSCEVVRRRRSDDAAADDQDVR